MENKRMVRIERTDSQIIITAPYNAEFISHAHNYAGKFNAETKAWSFDIRDEAYVLEACYLAYGEDGVRYNKCDVQITLPNGYSVEQGTIVFFGRQIARAFGRDSGAKLFDGVVVKKGGFTSGGSRKDWTTCARKGTQIILRDVSLPLVEWETDAETYGDAVVEILGGERDLQAERAELLARLAEIDSLMGAA
ncbi:hypothetical protein [Conchiformibius steedae]|uniref:hypothetical protein n=1 Tax=Conchiformibius steedae TaxID=153493 RepID=UPI0026EEEB35|nr:hypothetical protein [Conchiformibius steedae]